MFEKKRAERSGERTQFIRKAAIAFASVTDSGHGIHKAGYCSLLCSPKEAWELAKTLWDTKPEDC
jgi:hypothetical protein